MVEYIEREAALEEVDNADVMCDIPPDAYRVLRRYIERIPAADVVPVVRCGECKHWKRIRNDCILASCELYSLVRSEDFFCADGERKDGDGNV